MIITSPEGVLANFLKLTEVQTLDTFGPAAVILPGGGQIANILGMPIVMSRFMGADLEADGKFQVIKAQVAQAELYHYATTVRSLTGGRGIHSESFSHYEKMPKDQEKKVIKKETRISHNKKKKKKRRKV